MSGLIFSNIKRNYLRMSFASMLYYMNYFKGETENETPLELECRGGRSDCSFIASDIFNNSYTYKFLSTTRLILQIKRIFKNVFVCSFTKYMAWALPLQDRLDKSKHYRTRNICFGANTTDKNSSQKYRLIWN